MKRSAAVPMNAATSTKSGILLADAPRFRAYSSPSLSCWLGLKAFTLTPDSESAPKAKQTSNGPLFD